MPYLQADRISASLYLVRLKPSSTEVDRYGPRRTASGGPLSIEMQYHTLVVSLEAAGNKKQIGKHIWALPRPSREGEMMVVS